MVIVPASSATLDYVPLMTQSDLYIYLFVQMVIVPASSATLDDVSLMNLNWTQSVTVLVSASKMNNKQMTVRK